MRASISVDFTAEEVRKLLESGLKRLALGVLRDNPGMLDIFPEALRAGVAAAMHNSQVDDEPVPRPNPDGTFSNPRYRTRMPDSVPDRSDGSRCGLVEANRYQEAGWMCHECSTYNAAERAACRSCDHECCVEISSEFVPPIPPDMS